MAAIVPQFEFGEKPSLRQAARQEDSNALIVAFFAGQPIDGMCYAELAARMTNPEIEPPVGKNLLDEESRSRLPELYSGCQFQRNFGKE